jgi:hypothetical protein
LRRSRSRSSTPWLSSRSVDDKTPAELPFDSQRSSSRAAQTESGLPPFSQGFLGDALSKARDEWYSSGSDLKAVSCHFHSGTRGLPISVVTVPEPSDLGGMPSSVGGRGEEGGVFHQRRSSFYECDRLLDQWIGCRVGYKIPAIIGILEPPE